MTAVTHAVFFLRDDTAAPRIAAGVPALLAADPGIRVTVVDKTTEGFAETLDRIAESVKMTVLRAPRDEPFFRSWTRVCVDSGDYVIQLHDDDEWIGAPRNVAPDQAVYATRLTDDPAVPPSAMNFLFAAVRGDLWGAFTEFIEQFDVPDGSLDQPFCHMLASCWSGEDWVTDYTYVYDASDWNDEGRARAKNERLSREVGWGHLPGVATMLATARLNSLALHGFLKARYPDLATRWRSLPHAPAFRVAPLGMAPARLRAAIASSRGTGHGTGRLCHVLRAITTTSRSDAYLIAALADAASAQSRTDVESLLTLLSTRKDLSIDGHLRVWREWIR